MLTIITPFERTESSSLETNENRSPATTVVSFALSMDGSELKVNGVVAPVTIVFSQQNFSDYIRILWRILCHGAHFVC